jgi:hypothetical protein
VTVAGALALSVSALATPVGVNGPNFTTTPDTTPAGYTQPSGYTAPSNDGLGVASGAIKHVWVIVMENHAFETNFSGLNNNDYLSKELPKDGALLTNYYGTGHSSLDNYLSIASGQSPVTDTQGDCLAYTNMSGSVDTSGTQSSNGNYGQFASAAGANAPEGDNGCVYPSTVPTVFNQLDAANKTWKVYAQGVDNVSGVSSTLNSGESAAVANQNQGAAYCGAPQVTPGDTPSAGQTQNPNMANPVIGSASGSASAGDSYVAKHVPLPWFQSVLGSGDCNSAHLAPLFGINDQLYTDLQSDSSTPDLSVIIPNNCNDGHDAICKGNNLSGEPAGANTNAAEGTALNNVGGAYAQDLGLEKMVPEIMNSPAYSDGGLIAIVWDESYPQFTYSGDSFIDSTVSTSSAFNSLTDDQAGETLYGRSVNWEPSGPNVPNVQSQVGQQMSMGPGLSAYLERPGIESSETVPAPLVTCKGTPGTNETVANGFTTLDSGACLDQNGFAENVAGTGLVYPATTGGVVSSPAGATSSGIIAPNSEGEAVTLGNGATGACTDSGDASCAGTTGPFYVGQVTSELPAALTNGDGTSGSDTAVNDQPGTAQFQLVDAEGNAVTLSGLTSGSLMFNLAGPTQGSDPLYDAYTPTSGGGDTGAILLSPYIQGGTVSNSYYNHYSLLRSIEDIFDVTSGTASAAGYTGSSAVPLNTGVDGDGHIGYAAQPGLAPFGTDVFGPTSVTVTQTQTQTETQTVTKPGVTSTVTTPGATNTVTVPGQTKTVTQAKAVVPPLKGETLGQAKSAISKDRLKVGKVSGSGTVQSSSPKAGTLLATGSKVNLTLKKK